MDHIWAPEEHHDIHRIAAAVEGPIGDLMSVLFPYRDKYIGHRLLDRIIHRIEQKGSYETPREWFETKEYDTYMDYFTRKLSPSKEDEIKTGLRGLSMCIPCECKIEAIDTLDNADKIINLKESPVKMHEDMLALGIDATGMSFIDMKLFYSYYHRIHSPVKGSITNVTFIGCDSPLFGTNSTWIVEMECNGGKLYMILVGESNIQDFDFKIKEGEVRMFEEIGNFTWGSQVVLLYDPICFGQILVAEEEKYFVGESAMTGKELITHGGYGADPIDTLVPNVPVSHNYADTRTDFPGNLGFGK